MCKCGPKEFGCCEEVFEKYPEAEDGEYKIIVDGEVKLIYCVKDMPKCGDEKGWARVYNLDMTIDGSECPDGLFTHNIHDKGMFCDRDHCGGGNSACDKAIIPVLGLTYTTICGRIRGYQYDGTGRVEGIYDNTGGIEEIEPDDRLEAAYVDGVSVTLADMTQHIFTLIAGQRQDNNERVDCPCNDGASQTLPDFVGSDYYCESAGLSEENCNFLYHTDPLWDGLMCEEKELACCTSNSRLPFFRKDVETTMMDIEVRVCSSEGYPDEGTPIDQIEFYVR